MSALRRDPDRLLPADPGVRSVARRLYDSVADAPIVSPHGHLDPAMLLADEPFANPTELLIAHDHYVTRILQAAGHPLDTLVGDPRATWRIFCSEWSRFAGTPVRYWLEDELALVLGLTEAPSVDNADRLYDQVSERLTDSGMRPRALLDTFGIEVLATTDDPADDLAAHAALAADPSFPPRVIPTFRPDAYADPSRPGWRDAVTRLAAASGVDCATHAGMLEALRSRRAFFIERGATSTDHGTPDAWATRLDPAEAERIHAAGLAGTITAEDARAYQRHLLFESALMSADDGLVMQLHAGVLRNHHRPTFEKHGPDTGHDFPLPTVFTEPLRELLNAVGTDPTFRIVLFTVDETAFSRDIGPLAGFYPSVFAGAPWWFLDSPAAIRRYRAAVTDSAGFSKTSGFIDDTRALCSIPARHDMSRRIDAGYLAGLVAEHQLDEGEAAVIAGQLVGDIPRSVFRL